jgi:hypothetical protein
MAVVPVGYFAGKLRWRLAGDAEEIICTIGMKPHGTEGRPPTDVAEALYVAWLASFGVEGMMASYTFVGTSIKIGGPEGDGEAADYDKPVQGVEPNSTVPQNSAILVKKKSGRGGRHNSGRMFLPPCYFDQNQVDDAGVLVPAVVTGINANLENFRDSIGDDSPAAGAPLADMDLVIFHNDEGREPTPITSLICDNRLASQRQRLRR